MKFYRYVMAVCILLAAIVSQLHAEEYFVNKQGDDDNDGRSRQTAFLTIQRGVDALQAGETLTIGPGQYLESVYREDLGDADAETVIRAGISGSVVLRGDVPAQDFQKLEGYRSVYAADFDHDGEAQVVNELDTLTIFQGRPNIFEVEYTPGTFYHDTDSQKLYISTSDNQPPDQHRYSVSVLKGNGIYLSNPRRVVVEGIAVTGFNVSGFIRANVGNGIILSDARDCIIRDCQAWMNGWGIAMSSAAEGSGGNVIEGCVAWGNNSPFANWRKGGISIVRHRGDVIRDSEAFLNRQGLYLRSDSADEKTSRIADSLAWGNRWDTIIKGNPGLVNVTERTVGGAYSVWSESPRRNNPYHNLMLSGGAPPAEEGRTYYSTLDISPCNIWIQAEGDVDVYNEFADPDNRDYRLQATSRFRGTGPDGSDRGPFPYEENMFYVRPDGDDGADGLSVENAWSTLDRALQDLQPGNTLYISPGVYAETVELKHLGDDGEEPIYIRGRGLEPVVIDGDVHITESQNLDFNRLHFSGVVKAENSAEIAFRHSRFTAEDTAIVAEELKGLKIIHSHFNGFDQAAVLLNNSTNLHMTGNLLENHSGPAVRTDDVDSILYADYNAYRDIQASWEIGSDSQAYDEISDVHEVYSSTLPADFTLQQERLSLHKRPAFTAAGPLGNPYGPYRGEPRREKLRLTSGPRVHSVSATTANIEWTMLFPAQVHLAWGATTELENVDVFNTDYFGSYSLTGLEPGQTYYFQIKKLGQSERRAGQHAERQGVIETIPSEIKSELVSLTTADSDPDPVVYYVAPDGDDSNTGLDRDDAFETIQHAAGRAGAGDTVMIAGGTYEEQVRVRTTGAENAPITFRSILGEKVILSSGESGMSDAFSVAGKHHLRFDGMYLLSMWFNLYKSNNIEISRIFAGRYGRGYAPGFVNAHQCRDIEITNSVALSAKSGPRFTGCSNVSIKNSVFFRNMIQQVRFCSMPGEPISLTDNIFTDGLSGKYGAAMIALSRFDAFEESNNCFYPRRDWEDKHIVMLYSDEAHERCRAAYEMGETDNPHMKMDQILRLNFTEMQEYIGETDSVLAAPEFAGLADISDQVDYPVDRLTGTGATSLDKFFATNPEIVERGIGLQREAFEDFYFHKENGEN